MKITSTTSARTPTIEAVRALLIKVRGTGASAGGGGPSRWRTAVAAC
jgi:hypothetical protein